MRTVNAYIRNEAANDYLVVQVDPVHRQIVTPIPEEWHSEPAQYIRHDNGRVTVLSAASDMPGFLLALVRLACGLRQKDLGAMIGKRGASMINYYETSAKGGIPAHIRPLIYEALQIDHRPGIADREQLHRIKEFLKIQWSDIGRLTGLHPVYIKQLAGGHNQMRDHEKNRLYTLYAMLPDLEAGR